MTMLARAFAPKAIKNFDQMADAATPGGVYVRLDDRSTMTFDTSWADQPMTSVTFKACVDLLAKTFATLPLHIYERLDDDDRRIARDYPLYPVLHGLVHPYLTSFNWRRLMLTNAATWGNAYSEKVYDGLGRLQLWPIHPSRITPVWDVDGRKAFDYYGPDGSKKRYGMDRIFHLMNSSPDGLRGWSPVALHRAALRGYRVAEDYGTNFLENGARPGVVLSHPNNMSTPAISRLAGQMDEMRGSRNSGKTVILEEGMTITPIGIPPEDAQYMETRTFQKREVYQMFGIQPHKMGDLERATFSNIEHQSIEFISDTMLPWMENAEQEIQAQLIPESESQYYAEFDVDGYLRGDSKTRAEANAIRWQHGTLNANQWRRRENENKLPGKLGERYYVPVNYGEVEATDAPEIETPVEDEQPQLGDGLTVIKSASEFRCPDCHKLLVKAAFPGTVADCPRCKSEKTAA